LTQVECVIHDEKQIDIVRFGFRLFDQAHTVVFRGKSYRLKGRITTREVDSALRNQ
jgi:hypothetical protein